MITPNSSTLTRIDSDAVTSAMPSAGAASIEAGISGADRGEATDHTPETAAISAVDATAITKPSPIIATAVR